MENQYRMCDFCDKEVLAATFHEHVISNAHREERKAWGLRCGVSMSQLPFGVTEEKLQNMLESYGSIRSLSLNPYAGTAVAEFVDRDAAERFLATPLFIGNWRVHTAPKRISEPKRVIPAEDGINNAAIIAAIEEACKLNVTDVDSHIEIVVDCIAMKKASYKPKLSVIVNDVEECLSELLPGCRAVLFGSTVSGLLLKGDAIDISLCDGPNRKVVSQLRNKECAFSVRKLMLNHQQKFISVLEIPDAREPMITFVHWPSQTPCVLVFDDTQSPRTTLKLRCVLDLDTRIRPLILFIKYWAKGRKLIADGRFSGYMVTLLVVFCLQQISEAMVPALRLLSEKNIPEMAQNITNEDSLSKLIENFFSYYAKIKLGKTVLSPHTGGLVDRETFRQGPLAIQEELKLYRKILFSGAKPLKVDTPMVLQDPYEVSENLTSRVDEKTVADFQMCCKEALEIIKHGNLMQLLKAHCMPEQNSQQPTGEVNTTFRAARFLEPKYLVPEPDIVVVRKEMFHRFVNVMFVLLPDFLANFARLQVEPEDVPVEVNAWEPRTKVARLSERRDFSSRYAADVPDTMEGLEKRWLCTGRAVACTWQQRKKAAAELELAPTIHPVEREVLISKHLEQSYQSDEVKFCLILKVDESKERVRCVLENRDLKPDPFTRVAGTLITLFPLWVTNAFEIGFSLRCVTGVYIPGEMHFNEGQNFGM